MRTVICVLMLGIMSLTTLAFGAPAVGAETRNCTSRIGASTVDNLVVPAGKTCTLSGTKVKGSIWVSKGATLKATSVKVSGNIQSEGFKLVRVSGSTTVGGSIQLKDGKVFSIDGARVSGNIQVDENTGSSKIARNRVGGDIQVFQNDGRVSIGSNRVDGNLQCKQNSPKPTGSGNIVEGNKEDQCRRL